MAMTDNGQEQLWYESIYDAAAQLVYALGGPQKVAGKLWPSKDPIQAGRYLSQCVDPDRNEKLALDEFLQLMRWGREAGFHYLAKHIADECFYEFRVVEPEERRDDLRTKILHMSKEMQKMFKELERIEK